MFLKVVTMSYAIISIEIYQEKWLKDIALGLFVDTQYSAPSLVTVI